MSYKGIPKHKVFISYHHNNDEKYKKSLENWGEHFDGFISKAIDDGDIDTDLSTDTIYQKIRDDYIADSTVTIVLIGKDTWKRKYIDWEIATSIQNTKNNTRNGLIGILLPTYQFLPNRKYSRNTVPPRLYDNIKCGYATIHYWPETGEELCEWIHTAFERRNNEQVNPNNRRTLFSKNRPDSQSCWADK